MDRVAGCFFQEGLRNTAYLYFTRHNQGQGSLNRLVRVPGTFEAISR